MKTQWASYVLAFVVALSFGSITAAAQEKTTGGKPVTVTGCLQKQGDKAGEFSIVDADGKKYGLKSSEVKLADHLNHKVTVSGKLKEEKHEASSRPNKTESGDITVTNLTMISTSCQ